MELRWALSTQNMAEMKKVMSEEGTRVRIVNDDTP